MDRTALVALLVEADDSERAALLARHAALANVELAQALKELFDRNESSEPARAIAAAAALEALARMTDDPEVRALADWTSGMAVAFSNKRLRSGAAGKRRRPRASLVRCS